MHSTASTLDTSIPVTCVALRAYPFLETSFALAFPPTAPSPRLSQVVRLESVHPFQTSSSSLSRKGSGASWRAALQDDLSGCTECITPCWKVAAAVIKRIIGPVRAVLDTVANTLADGVAPGSDDHADAGARTVLRNGRP